MVKYISDTLKNFSVALYVIVAINMLIVTKDDMQEFEAVVVMVIATVSWLVGLLLTTKGAKNE